MEGLLLNVAHRMRRAPRALGVARVWLDDDTGAAVLLNGSWASRTSQTDLSVVRIAALCQRSCLAARRAPKHRVSVQLVSGRKFKLLSLEMC